MHFFSNRAVSNRALSPLTLGLVAGTSLLSCSFKTQAAPETSESHTTPFTALGPLQVRNVSRGPATPLSLDLQRLAERYAQVAPGEKSALPPTPPAKGNANEGVVLTPATVDAVLLRSFGLSSANRTTPIEVAIRLRDGVPSTPTVAALRAAGASVRFASGRIITAAIPIGRLNEVGGIPGLASIDAVKNAMTPPQFAPEKPRQTRNLSRGPATGLGKFDAKGLTGKGVIVAVIDSGIDWKHDDFRRPDGTSRILALWDVFDDSWGKSKVGSAPPAQKPDGTPVGTVYTNAQINAALKGAGVVNSRDVGGHGTACAGTAAGNGRATGNGVPAGTIKGVAPEADLVVVKVSPPYNHRGIADLWLTGTQWAIQTAKNMKRPVVVSQSFGNNSSSKDGTSLDEVSLDELVGTGKPGVAICVAAGNEGRYSFHAAGRFGPDRPGQADNFSKDVDLVVKAEKTRLIAYFDAADDWGLSIIGYDSLFTDEDETGTRRKGRCQILKKGTVFTGRLAFADTKSQKPQPDDFKWFFNNCVEFKKINAKTQSVEIILTKGRYNLAGFGATDNVTNGRFDLVLPSPSEADFGRGTVKEVMVSSPGTASGVITVGAMDSLGQWQNMNGTTTYVNLELGQISDYSSPGFRRDGVVKPDIAAPASYTLSSLAKDSEIGKDDGKPDAAMITQDGQHVAWMGTSAATPYVAGVVALMLEKNPTLDGVQIQRILQRTARHSLETTGAVPNPRWGYGAIDPAAAIAAVPALNAPAAKGPLPKGATPRRVAPKGIAPKSATPTKAASPKPGIPKAPTQNATTPTTPAEPSAPTKVRPRSGFRRDHVA